MKVSLRHCVKALGLTFEAYCVYEHRKIHRRAKSAPRNSFPEPRQYFLMNATAALLELIGLCVCVCV